MIGETSDGGGPARWRAGWPHSPADVFVIEGAVVLMRGVDLTGKEVAFAAEWPTDFWSGNGKGRLYIRATPEQRRELEAIFRASGAGYSSR